MYSVRVRPFERSDNLPVELESTVMVDMCSTSSKRNLEYDLETALCLISLTLLASPYLMY